MKNETKTLYVIPLEQFRKMAAAEDLRADLVIGSNCRDCGKPSMMRVFVTLEEWVCSDCHQFQGATKQ